MIFYSFDLELGPMFLVLKFDLDIVKMFCVLKMKLLALAVQKLPEHTHTHTHTHTQTQLKLLPTHIRRYSRMRGKIPLLSHH